MLPDSTAERNVLIIVVSSCCLSPPAGPYWNWKQWFVFKQSANTNVCFKWEQFQPSSEQHGHCVVGDLRKCLFCMRGGEVRALDIARPGGPPKPLHLPTHWPNMSPAGHNTCTMIIAHACTMIIVHVSCPTELMLGPIKDGRGSSGESPCQWCVPTTDLNILDPSCEALDGLTGPFWGRVVEARLSDSV